ncbi:MAG: dihydrodipicolinate reductase [Litoreibacter sp.]|nr:dihydrodipicolinate reductase [Litoreibacter sp.]MCY4335899.1 dihydrodipicolinate reductase [Litoreibacter sp.]
MRKTTSIGLLVAFLLAPLSAYAFEKIDTKDKFLSLVEGKTLRLTGIKVQVTPSGEITGRAFGRGVKGAWNWQNGYFCRSLYWGNRDLGQNCQEVRAEGSKVRFTSDRGEGQYAVLNIR